MKHGIAVVFPGTGYTCKEKLLQECTKKYTSLGYDIVKLDFSSIPYKEIDTLEEAVEITKKVILHQLDNVLFNKYENVVFISKSLGTICATFIEDYFNITPIQFYLTPLEQTIKTIKTTSKVGGMVIGTEDSFLDYKKMEVFCVERKIPYLIISGAGHSLKLNEEEVNAEDINIQIVNLCSTH